MQLFSWKSDLKFHTTLAQLLIRAHSSKKRKSGFFYFCMSSPFQRRIKTELRTELHCQNFKANPKRTFFRKTHFSWEKSIFFKKRIISKIRNEILCSFSLENQIWNSMQLWLNNWYKPILQRKSYQTSPILVHPLYFKE